MKIGIITWFTYENCGTKLQAIALQKYLRNIGHDVSLINFEPPDSFESKKRDNSILKKMRNTINLFQLHRAQVKYQQQLDTRKAKFRAVIEKNCVLTNELKTKEQYIRICNTFDILICGSDQIWNPYLYHPYYYADFPELKTKRIAYAPSLGTTEIPEFRRNDIAHSLGNFSAVSIREQCGVEEVQKLVNIKVEKVLDPTFLLSKSEWKETLQLYSRKVKHPYVFCYFLGSEKKHWTAVKKYADKHDLQIIVFPQQGDSYFVKGFIEADAGVEQFVEFISGADCVMTDSFHATVFSLIFQKPFYVFERFKPAMVTSQNSRIYDLLDLVDLSQRMIPFGSYTIEEALPIDYSLVEGKLMEQVCYSKYFLEKEVKK